MKLNTIIFPKLKTAPVDKNELAHNIDGLAHHYSEQIFHSLKHHGVEDDPKFHTDMMFLRELLKAIIMRSQGEHHSLQEWIDDIYVEELDDFEE